MTSDTEQYTVAALGEILWDLFPDGPRFGGAPANFAVHAAALGAHAEMVSGIGDDLLGSKAIERLKRANVNTDFVQVISGQSTGTVEIELDPSGSAIYLFGDDDPWDHLLWSDRFRERVARLNAVCFGTLGQRAPVSQNTIQYIVESTSPHALRVFDINLRDNFYSEVIIDRSLNAANVLKLSEEELPILAEQYKLAGSQDQQLYAISRMFDLYAVAFTRGHQGAMLVMQNKTIANCNGFPTDVIDTVGAGDCYTAALTIGLLREWDAELINQRACRLASFVCSQAGATPKLPNELAQPFVSDTRARHQSIYSSQRFRTMDQRRPLL